MLWLQPIPWARWAAAAAIAAVALWVELAPDPTSQHPFAIVDIARGQALNAANTELRDVPAGLLESPGRGGYATRDIPAGSPLAPGDAGEPGRIVPDEWWIVACEVPPGAMVGDPVKIVLLDTAEAVQGVVTSAETDDPFVAGLGAVAVPPEAATDVAVAAAEGRMVVLVGTG